MWYGGGAGPSGGINCSKADGLKNTGVPGKGIDSAPGLQKAYNDKSKAADNAGKKK